MTIEVTIEVWIRVCMHSNEMIQVSMTGSYGHWTISLSFKNLVSPELLCCLFRYLMCMVYYNSRTRSGALTSEVKGPNSEDVP